jgi:hypothetical protein
MSGTTGANPVAITVIVLIILVNPLKSNRESLGSPEGVLGESWIRDRCTKRKPLQKAGAL